ncbi:MAG TPA: TerB family tellurite resistance protein [Bacteroidales bacterium]|nr:TerB family tellurite resistance protein [Bacteroidales bacterium]HPS17107.1 TerB family tellurite resistance protein [Bacteroidales bacterium]
MGRYGKWLGGGLGWVLGGPIGGIIGFIAGSMYDTVSTDSPTDTANLRHRTSSDDFFVSLLILSSAVMKADNKVLKSELDFVRKFFTQQIGATRTQQYMLILRDIMQKEYSLHDVCSQIRHFMEMPLRLQMLHYLFGIAKADGFVSESETETIHKIANYLGINPNDYESIKAMFVHDSKSAYKILEISPDASDEEVKKAYRKMALKYHPDKVSHLGEEVQKAANEKFKELNNSYETIKKERGMN